MQYFSTCTAVACTVLVVLLSTVTVTVSLVVYVQLYDITTLLYRDPTVLDFPTFSEPFNPQGSRTQSPCAREARRRKMRACVKF